VTPNLPMAQLWRLAAGASSSWRRKAGRRYEVYDVAEEL